jgi:hypothetical protein
MLKVTVIPAKAGISLRSKRQLLTVAPERQRDSGFRWNDDSSWLGIA